MGLFGRYDVCRRADAHAFLLVSWRLCTKEAEFIKMRILKLIMPLPSTGKTEEQRFSGPSSSTHFIECPFGTRALNWQPKKKERNKGLLGLF